MPEIRPSPATEPAHWDSDIDALDMIAAQDWDEQFVAGNAIKYLSRYHKKGTPREDIIKAIWYAGWLLAKTEGKSVASRRAIAQGLAGVAIDELEARQ